MPDPAIWPDVQWTPAPTARRINLDTLTRDDVLDWKPGDTLLLSGRMLTGRDAAHKRIADLFASGAGLPAGVDFTDRFIYYVGPVDPVREEVVGPAGPTTSTRMDRFTDMMLEKTGLLGMIGKAERGAATIESIKRHKVVYLIAVGGAAYLVSKAIRSSRVVAFADLGMEAILRVRSGEHAGYRCRGFAGQLHPRHGACRVAKAHLERSQYVARALRHGQGYVLEVTR